MTGQIRCLLLITLLTIFVVPLGHGGEGAAVQPPAEDSVAAKSHTDDSAGTKVRSGWHIPYGLVPAPISELLRFLSEKSDQIPRIGDPEGQTKQVDARPATAVSPSDGRTERNCDRAIPTREEFLRLLKTNPADANQLLQRCKPDIRSLSPFPQFPPANRQLPAEARQRADGTSDQ